MTDIWAAFPDAPASAPPTGAADPWAAFPDAPNAPTAGDQGAGAAGALHWANQTLGGLGPQAAGVIQGALDVTGLDQHRGGVDRAAPGVQQPQTVADLAAALEPGKPRPSPSIGSFTGGYNNTVDQGNANLDITAAQHPVASTAGDIGGGLTLASMIPGGAIARGLGIAGKAGTIAAKVGEGFAGSLTYGAISGAGNARGGIGDRIKGALEGAAVAGPLGVAGGGLAGAFASRGAAAAAPSTNAVTAAAERLGIKIPVAAATDSLAVQKIGQAAKAVPLFGQRMVAAGNQTLSDAGQAAGKIAEGYGQGGVAATAASAGAGARDALTNWIGPLTKGVTGNMYDAVDALVNPTVTTPLNATAKIATGIVKANTAATLPPGEAVQLVRQAVSRPQGLTYDGIKTLRTRVGELIDAGPMPGNPAQGELKRIYGALTTDLRTSVENAGGPAARKAFDRANLLNAAVAKRRDELMRVLGVNPKNPASGEAVFAKIENMAGSSSAADIATLGKVRKSMPPEVWNDVSSAVVGRLGSSPATGQFSLDKFFTGYNKISAAGKQALFGGKRDLATALDDLRTVASRFKAIETFANKSGTAQVGGSVAFGAGIVTNPIHTLAMIIPAHVLTRALSRPATVRAMTSWAKVYNRGLRGPSQLLGQSLQFSARRLAVQIGLQFRLAGSQVDHLAFALQGSPSAQPAPNQPGQSQ